MIAENILVSIDCAAMDAVKSQAKHAVGSARLGLLVLLGGALLCGCVPQIPLTSWSSPLPASSPLYPEIITTGDILEARYYLDSVVQGAPYKLGAGDVIRVDIDGNPELSRDQVHILPDGKASLPLIGAVEIVGKTTEEAGRLIAQRYMQYAVKEPVVVVSVVEAQQRLKRLLESRPMQPDGVALDIPIYQGVPIALPFIAPVAVDRPLSAIRQDILSQYKKEFGSQLNVLVNLRQRETPTVAIMGEVKVPGRINMTQPLTPMAAIAAAGGFTEQGDPERIAVLRFAPGGTYQRWLFNFRESVNELNTAHHNFTLSKNDVVVVIRTDIADLNLGIAQYIRNNIPLQTYIGYMIPTGP
jgi:protein involved in polysaccharide export with SLBB domain